MNNNTDSFGFSSIFRDVITFFTSNYWNILFFFITLIAGIFVIKFLLKLIKKIFARHGTDALMQRFILTVTKCVTGIVLVLVLFRLAGIEITGIVTALSAALLAIGVALQSYISNLASGIIIACSKMYHKNDYIIVNNVEGKIDNIGLLFTTLYTYDKQKIVIPNSKITAESVVNVFTNDSRRVTFKFNVAYESDMALVKKVITDVISSDKKVLADPAPFCSISSYQASSIEFTATCWCKSEDYWKVYYFVMENMYNEFKRNGIVIPFQQTEIRIRTDSVEMPVIEKIEKKHNTDPAKAGKEKDFARRGVSK